MKNAKPCPFCGSELLTTTLWCGDDGEFDAVSCTSCGAEAPEAVWNQRAEFTKSLPKVCQTVNANIEASA